MEQQSFTETHKTKGTQCTHLHTCLEQGIGRMGVKNWVKIEIIVRQDLHRETNVLN